VIYKLEERLPEKPFTEERDLLLKENPLAKKTGEFPITRIERWVPIIIGFVFVLMFILPLFAD